MLQNSEDIYIFILLKLITYSRQPTKKSYSNYIYAIYFQYLNLSKNSTLKKIKILKHLPRLEFLFSASATKVSQN